MLKVLKFRIYKINNIQLKNTYLHYIVYHLCLENMDKNCISFNFNLIQEKENFTYILS